MWKGIFEIERTNVVYFCSAENVDLGEEDIDDLVVERDEEVKLVYELRLKLADAWNIEFAADAEKVREVARLTEKNE